MISHVVLFRPHQTLGPAQKADIVQHLQGAVALSPTVRACRIGRRVTHGLPGYEQHMSEDYQYVLILEFDNVEGLTAYLQNPAHAAIGGLFTSAAAASLAYDYELVELTNAAQLI